MGWKLEQKLQKTLRTILVQQLNFLKGVARLSDVTVGTGSTGTHLVTTDLDRLRGFLEGKYLL